jgi:hypothetical protein
VGIGGLLKTLIGFMTGAFGTQFVVAKPYARAMIVGAATVIHGFMAIGLQAVIRPALAGDCVDVGPAGSGDQRGCGIRGAVSDRCGAGRNGPQSIATAFGLGPQAVVMAC